MKTLYDIKVEIENTDLINEFEKRETIKDELELITGENVTSCYDFTTSKDELLYKTNLFKIYKNRENNKCIIKFKEVE